MLNYLRQFLAALFFPIRALLTSPQKLFSSSQRLFGISLPARVAVLVWFFLLLCVAISFLVFWNDPNRPFWQALTGKPWFLPVIVMLVVAIPILVYHVLRLWLEGDVSPFEDISLAWREGVAELERQGLDLSQIPLFLIVGSAGERLEKALFDAARLSLNIREFPPGPRALHWYANPEAVYVVASQVGCLSKLTRTGKDVMAAERARGAQAGPPLPAGPSIRGTIVPGANTPAPGRAASEESITASGPLPEPVAGALGSGGVRGTMEISSLRSSVVPTAVPSGADSSKRPVKLAPDESNLEERRLEYLCRLIRRARRPLCPLNGIVALLPFELIKRGPSEGVELQKALQRDMKTLRRVLMIRCPATAVVEGVEEDDGFRELVRRVGRQRAVQQRFGKGFSLGNPPIPERLEALTAHACGAFEAWVYAQFREKGSLAKPGNRKLYSLLCNIRRNVQLRLGNILVAGFGSDPDLGEDAEPLFFGGCYFAATGESEDRQAFVRGVFDKLPEEQAELQWTNRALREDQKYRWLAWAVLGYDALVALALAALLVTGYWSRWR